MNRLLAAVVGLLLCGSLAADSALVRKQGGIGFRYDDNRSVAQWKSMADIFNKYGFPLMYAINCRDDKTFTAEQQAFLRELVKQGHELMDHTIDHRVFKFSAPDAKKYLNEPWVDHASGNVLYVKYIFREDVPARYASKKLKVDFAGDQVILPQEFHKLFQGNHLLKYQGKAYLVIADRKQKNLFRVRSFWGEPVNMGSVKGADVESVSKNYGFAVPPAAMKAQAEVVAKRFEAMGLPRPTAWIQPGSPEAIIRADNVRAGLKDCGYISAATYQDSAFKVYCESDPQRCAFAMMWGQLHLERAQSTFSSLKTKIADGYALHQVLFASSHMSVSQLPGGWQEFLKRHDELLAWCKEKGIPVRTQSQWAKLLYYSKTDPAQNIFPAWTVDLDGNNRPDGYKSLGQGVTVNAAGELTAPGKGEVFSIAQLGGLEKGKNTLRFEVKSGKPRCEITFWNRWQAVSKVTFSGNEKTFDVPANTDHVSIWLWNDGDTPLVLTGASLK